MPESRLRDAGVRCVRIARRGDGRRPSVRNDVPRDGSRSKAKGAQAIAWTLVTRRRHRHQPLPRPIGSNNWQFPRLHVHARGQGRQLPHTGQRPGTPRVRSCGSKRPEHEACSRRPRVSTDPNSDIGSVTPVRLSASRRLAPSLGSWHRAYVIVTFQNIGAPNLRTSRTFFR